MIKATHWSPGDVIVYRGAKQKIWYALPVYVVQDTPDLVALYWPAGTRGKWRLPSSGARVRPRDVLNTPMSLVDYTWVKTDVLMLITPGAAHAVYLMWETGQRNLLCWYINLQDPIHQTAIGYDTADHALDLVFSPDRATWHWKDEDQLEEAVSIGLFSSEDALMIRSEGERVIQLIRENRPPFCDGWEKWSPPAGWTPLELCDEWEIGYDA